MIQSREDNKSDHVRRYWGQGEKWLKKWVNFKFASPIYN
jgi:hypothetical protein